MTDVQVAVIGGGLSGLLTALALEERGIGEVAVLEAGPAAGGVARTLRSRGFALEPGVGSFPWPHSALTPLLERAEVKVEPAHAHGRFVSLDGKLHDVTRPLRALRLVPWSARLRMAAEPLVRWRPRDEDPSLETFLGGRLGKTAGRVVAQLMAAGVFAGDPAKLSTRSAFPMLTGLVEAHGSLAAGMWARRRSLDSKKPRTHLPAGGVDQLADTIASHLGPRLRLGTRVTRLERTANAYRVGAITAAMVVVTVGGEAAASLVGGALGADLGKTVTAPVLVAGFAAPAAAAPLPQGFGALCLGASPVVGILFESSYAPERAPDGQTFVKVIAGGARHTEVAGWDRARVESDLGGETAGLLSWAGAPRLELIANRSIPQYPPGHRRWLAGLEGQLAGSGIHLAGWSYRGPGLTQLAIDARRVAEAIAAGANLG
ncbi:MAG TPA: protoporphyrinogen oxidase [Acidimicrobiia bacterium]|nr:protoporphyrinogen oxidase [Acidimicrobiia bacterium]